MSCEVRWRGLCLCEDALGEASLERQLALKQGVPARPLGGGDGVGELEVACGVRRRVSMAVFGRRQARKQEGGGRLWQRETHPSCG